MAPHTRREFLAQVGQGMLLAGLGSSLVGDLGLAKVFADEGQPALSFGELEPLVALMQETPPAKLTELLVEKLKTGADLKSLVGAAALANARTFGGEDYVGFHTFMALAPAYRMALELPLEQRPLPVLKVLYRNANRIQEFGGRPKEVLRAIVADENSPGNSAGEKLRDASRAGDVKAADRTFAALSAAPLDETFNHLLLAVEDEVDVHRVVLAWRAWDTLDIAGPAWAHTLLRQSIHYCASTERQMIDRKYPTSPIRTLLPKLLDEHQLLGRPVGTKAGDDAWIAELAGTVMRGTREQGAIAVAQSLRDGYSGESIGQALSLAANLLLLHDPGRPQQWANAEKPVGSVHGDSVGVHASDAVNAWRNIVRVSNPRNVVASLIVAGFHTGGQSDRANADPFPLQEHLAEVKVNDAAALLAEAENAIHGSDQFRAAAVMARYGQLDFDSAPAFAMLLKYAASADGALHAEKFYHTAKAEFATLPKAHRWGQVTALARVCASQYGYKSPGYEQAKELLGV